MAIKKVKQLGHSTPLVIFFWVEEIWCLRIALCFQFLALSNFVDVGHSCWLCTNGTHVEWPFWWKVACYSWGRVCGLHSILVSFSTFIFFASAKKVKLDNLFLFTAIISVQYHHLLLRWLRWLFFLDSSFFSFHLFDIDQLNHFS